MKRTILRALSACLLPAAFLLSSCRSAATGTVSGTGETTLPETPSPLSVLSESGTEDSFSAETTKREEPIVCEKLSLQFTEKDLVATGNDKAAKNGANVRYSAWESTGYIDVTRFAALRYELAAHRYLYSAAFYDENGNFLGGEATDSVLGYTLLQGHARLPEGTKYARFARFTGSGEYSHVSPDTFVEGFLSADDYERYLQSRKHEGLKIVCLGDSLTEGDFGGVAGVANKHYLNYPYYLSKILECETVNDGRCGYAPSGYLSLYSGGTVNVKDADVVLLMLGTNGGLTYRGSSEKAAYRNLISMIRRDLPKGAKLILLTPPHATEIPGKVNYGYAPWVENAVKEVRALASSMKLPLIDVYAESPIREENEDLYQPADGLHMNAAGYEALARFLAAKIEELLG